MSKNYNDVITAIPSYTYKVTMPVTYYSDDSNEESEESNEEVDLNDNMITVIPSYILEMHNVTILKLCGNQLSSVFPLCNMINLEILLLGRNLISFLPDEFVKLINLTEIGLHQNQFTEFPKVLCQMPSLQIIGLRENQITDIPPEIGKLVNLEELYVQNNKIKSIPIELTQLSKLKFLWMQNNEIIDAFEFMSNLRELTELSELFLNGNQFTIPEKIIPGPNMQVMALDNGICGPTGVIHENMKLL